MVVTAYGGFGQKAVIAHHLIAVSYTHLDVYKRQTLEELKEAADKIGFPCVVKPLMSSSGKGQSLVKSADELEPGL